MTQKSENLSPMSVDEWVQIATESIVPIDFDGLITTGVLEKRGAWYKVNRWNELPLHARAKIYAAKSGDSTLVKFRAPSKKLAKLLKK